MRLYAHVLLEVRLLGECHPQHLFLPSAQLSELQDKCIPCIASSAITMEKTFIAFVTISRMAGSVVHKVDISTCDPAIRKVLLTLSVDFCPTLRSKCHPRCRHACHGETESKGCQSSYPGICMCTLSEIVASCRLHQLASLSCLTGDLLPDSCRRSIH